MDMEASCPKKGPPTTGFRHRTKKAARLSTLSALALLALTSCDTWGPSKLKIPPVSPGAYREYKLHIDREKNIGEGRCVFIDGQDIQLPLTAGAFDPQDNRTYSFYVWANNPDASPAQSLEEMRAQGIFSLEVIGVKASISVPNYLPAAGPPQMLLNSVTNGMAGSTIDALKSMHVLEVRVRSRDITGPFTIIAWFPEKYRNWQIAAPTRTTASPNRPAIANPYGEKRQVKVYNGDLRTQIVMVDEPTARAAFGSLFPDYFYIGRVYLRNRHPDKRMVVYTTSLRANILMYRPPLGSSDDQPPQTDLKTADIADLNQQALDRKADRDQKLSETELNTILDKGFERTAEAIANPTNQNSYAVEIFRSVVTNRDPAIILIKSNSACYKIELVWKRLAQFAGASNHLAVSLRSEAVGLADSLSARPRCCDDDESAKQKIAAGFAGLAQATDYTQNRARYIAATNAIIHTDAEPAEQRRLLSLADEIHGKLCGSREAAMFALAFSNYAPQYLYATPSEQDPGGQRQEFDRIIALIRYEAAGNDLSADNPFARIRDILVNSDPRALAYSEDSDRQKQLAEVGYLWHETYRPMTFQAVLNSLMDMHNNTVSAKTMRILQSVAALAGGMVGLGSVINEFNSQAYLSSVNLFSTIIVPELGKLILEDLNKHIRNLGDMAMDTVVIVPPNDVVDRYIFFPKGPIYNFASEFDVKSPTYIKSIDSDDVGVEATLIDQGVAIRGGGLDAEALTARALNEGQAEASAELLKQAVLSDRLRMLELSTLRSRIEALLAGTVAADTNGVKSGARMEAEAEACKLIKSFKTRHGEDTTGVLAALTSQFQFDCDSTPPVIDITATPIVNLLGGVPSHRYVLPVSDIMGAWNLKITNITSSNPDVIPPENIHVEMPAPDTRTPVYFTLQAATNAAARETVQAGVTFTIINVRGLSTNLTVPITIHHPQIDIQVVGGAVQIGDTLTMTSPDAKAFLNLKFPVFDSDLDGDTMNWNFAPLNLQTNGWYLAMDADAPRKTVRSGGQSQLEIGLEIDPSLTFTNRYPATFTISVLCGSQEVARTNLQAVLPTTP